MIADTLPQGFRPLQVTAAYDCYASRRRILADAPGAGKTLEILLALELDGAFTTPGYFTIITAPKTACQLTWARELRIRVAEQYPVIICDLTGRIRGKANPSLADRDHYLRECITVARTAEFPLIVLANFEALRAQPSGKAPVHAFWETKWTSLIIDESHLVVPTRTVDPKGISQFLRGVYALTLDPGGILLSVTGTPDRGKLENRFGHYRLLYPAQFPDYWGWVRSNFHTRKNDFNGVDILSLKDSDEWNRFQRAVMTRRTKAEMLSHLPPKIWVGDNGDNGENGAILLPPTEAQKEAMERYEADFFARLADREAEGEDTRGMPMEFSLRSRQYAICDWYIERNDEGAHATPLVRGRDSSAKLGWILLWLEERGYHADNYDPDGGKVVIVSFFTRALEWLRKELAAEGYVSNVMSGDTPLADKHRLEESFQRGNDRILLLSGYLGVSINLDAADDMIFLDMAHDPDVMEQAEDRIHRASSDHQVQYWRLAIEGSIDEAILETMDKRYRATRRSYDGSRGIEYARKILSHAGATLNELEV